MTTTTHFVAENRYHTALSEKPEDELLLAVRKHHADAEECRQELIARGWKAEWIK
jgi:hypothetical protein